MFSLFAMFMVVGALDFFTAGETLYTRHPLGAYPRAPGGRTQRKTPFGALRPELGHTSP
jgi:hypothetical protein